ncbi:porin family protein [Cognatitamlana onchidii]|uniref:porin family protein n=1 Tax=Cognatitamlana onchidii TaxID=2562860 RepID=UPI0010A5B30B|nr:porin family protein [Algibacter onchidii]
MKKLFLIPIMVLAFSIMNAQNEKGDFTVAPQLGLNFSNYSSSESLNNKIRTAFNVGATVEYYLNNRWSFRSGLIYDSKGTKITISGQDFIDKLNYIAIPLHANWHFGSRRNWFLNFGPTIGFLVSAKADTPEGNVDVKDMIESSFDVGLGVGIGYKFDIANDTQLYIQYQGYNGFVDLFDEDFSVFNATSAFNVGVIFDI